MVWKLLENWIRFPRREQVWISRHHPNDSFIHCSNFRFASPRVCMDFVFLHAWKIRTLGSAIPHSIFFLVKLKLVPLAARSMSSVRPNRTVFFFGHFQRRSAPATKWSDQFGLRSLACVRLLTTNYNYNTLTHCVHRSKPNFGSISRFGAMSAMDDTMEWKWFSGWFTTQIGFTDANADA